MKSPENSIAKLLQNEFGLFDLESDTPIFSENRLDSMDVLRLVIALEKEFSISISAFDASLEMFDTIQSIATIVKRKLT